MQASQRQAIRERIAQIQISAIIRSGRMDIAQDAMQAAVEGGFRMVEFTLTTPGALDMVTRFRREHELLVGAGTILTVEQARSAVAAGAQFLVSPVFDHSVIEEAHRLHVACIPAGYTPTELQTAHELGADFIKLFPAPAGGVDFVHAVLAPLPHLRLFPTAGITLDNFTDYLSAGCAGVGFVKALFDPADLKSGNYRAIADRAAAILHRYRDWRASQRAD